MARVVITRDDAIERALVSALGQIDLEPLIRNKLVAVKPNDTWDSPEDKKGATHPDTLRGVLRRSSSRTRFIFLDTGKSDSFARG